MAEYELQKVKALLDVSEYQLSKALFINMYSLKALNIPKFS